MLIKALAENTSVSDELGCEHGLSLYIETPKHNILFDMGMGELFAKNALLMDVDLRCVDIAFISHGHYDHGGGLKTFFNINDTANVHMCRKAFDEHYAFEYDGLRFIGLDQSLLDNNRFVFVGNQSVIDEELETFSDVQCQRLNPSGNDDLLMMDGDTHTKDNFQHEQSLVLHEGEKLVLISGCSHCGIVNILDRFHEMYGRYPDTVIGGFHLSNPGKGGSEDPEIVRQIADFMMKTGASFYTCHCTGLKSFERLKAVLGDKIDYLSGGRTIEI